MEPRWTMEMDEQLTTMWIANASNDEISRVVGKPASAVMARAARLSLGQRDKSVIGKATADGKVYWTAAEDRQLLEMRRQGVSSTKIGKAMGRARGGVQSRLLKLDNSKPKGHAEITGLRNCMRCRAKLRSEGRNGPRLCYTCN
ncbi:hypothetical protein IFT59_07305 [Rhizobium sp. CFBP 8752]|uniref:hypothetical protein n=1 Tax=Rhizobium sp. CFBP 8752 TaxID=2775301 RepID=UPI00177B37A2|nr:hypothetical protein [Rhizobium sp. CFBP 8752]MBD8663059.1 hypothetical protein [Rhizobium sp. CFBP 8752]